MHMSHIENMPVQPQRVRPIVRFPEFKWGQPIEGLVWENERCIEMPLARDVMGFWEPGAILDAGCALNSKYSEPLVSQLTHLTQDITTEDRYLQPNRMYVEGDLRDLSRYADRAFDRVGCVSTLEHIGCDNTTYGGPVEDRPETVVLAAAELWRVCKDRLFVTVPVRLNEHRCAKWRYFTPDSLRMELLLYWPGADVRYYRRGTDEAWSGPYDLMAPIDVEQEGDLKTVQQIACILVRR